MMTIQEVLKQMRSNDVMRESRRIEVWVLEQWADAIEAAVIQPVAEVVPSQELPYGGIRMTEQFPPGTKFYTMPPDAAGEIEFLNQRLKEAEAELEFYRKAALAGKEPNHE